MALVERRWVVPFLALGVASAACSSASEAPPLPVVTNELPVATPELEEYGIDPYEHVAWEGDPALAGDADYPRPSDIDPSELVFPNDGDADAPEELEVEDAEQVELESLAGELEPTTIRLLAGGAKPTWWSKTFTLPYTIKNDPRNRVGKRICRGAPFNCPAPNPHADANRLHPRAARDTFYRSARDEADRKRYEASGWAVKSGTTVYEGGGRALGTITEASARAVKVNFGVLHEMNVGQGTQTFLYGWAVNTEKGTTSGWIRRDDFVDGAGSELARGTKKETPPRTPRGLREEEWVVKPATELGTCGIDDFDADPDKPCLSRLDKEKGGIGRFSELKVIPRENGKNGKVGDYLLRSRSILNLAYATPRLGGPSLDSRHVGTGIPFLRVMSNDTRARATLLAVPLFTKGGTKVVGSMKFAFGHFAGDDTYGWIALDAIRQPCARPDGRICNAAGTGALTCRDRKVAARQECPAGQRCQGIEGDTAQTMICR